MVNIIVCHRVIDMLLGVPKEIKNHEYRVGMTPASVREVIARGHEVIVETCCGAGSGFLDAHYEEAGATLVGTAEEVFQRAEMIVKVKEPQSDECLMLRENQLLFTYLHLAPDPEQTRLLVDSGAVCVAYETVTDASGGLPLLAPMSEVAGRMSIQAATHYLEKAQGGSGVLLGGVPGVAPAKVLIIGGGVVGTNAAKMAVGMGADVTLLDRSLPRLRELSDIFGSTIKPVYSTSEAIDQYSRDADVVIGGVLLPGAAAPKLIRREHLQQMRPGSVIADVAIDQGGCFETSVATTHQDPVYEVEGIVHYCVANMPGGVARTSTMSLNNATLPFIRELADLGAEKALSSDPHLLNGLNVYRGHVTCEPVASALDYQYMPASNFL